MKLWISFYHSLCRRPFLATVKALFKSRGAGLAAATLLALLMFVPSGMAQDVTFSKTRYSSVKQPKEAEVALTITDSKILIKGKEVNGIDMEIPFSSIDSMSYEVAARHRVAEGAMLGSIALMTVKTKSHWLDIEYREGDAKQLTTLRLDKSEYKKVIATLETRTGKQIATLKSNKSPFNPTAGSKDMDEVIPFRMDAVAAALKPAMESVGCNVTHATSNHLECKREWAKGRDTERTGAGGEKVTASLEAKGEQTRVRVSTEKGVRGRMVKRNWSTPIYNEMMKTLQKPA
ncbi:MAG: hypothetical protein WBP79_02465 [Candidatus Acidiferrales bacterium]